MIDKCSCSVLFITVIIITMTAATTTLTTIINPKIPIEVLF